MKIPITPQLVSEWEVARSKASELENQITERIDYILNVWFKTFGGSLKYWYFDGAGENEVGDLAKYMGDESIYGLFIECNPNSKNEMVIINKDGSEWGWESEIPTRWLFEDFENEIINGKKLYEERAANRKAKKKELTLAKKQEDATLIEEAKKKLSKKELAALRRSL